MSFHQNLRLFDVDIWQLSEGKFQGHLIEAASEQVQIDRHCHNRLLKIEGSPKVNWAFGIPAYPLCLLFEQKYLLDESYILISPPRSGFTMIQKSAYGLYVIYFTETFFDHLCQEYHLPEPRQFLGNNYYSPSAVKCYSRELNSLRRSICQLYQGLLSLCSVHKFQSLSDLIFKQFMQKLELEIPKKLLLILAQAQQIQPKAVLLKRTAILNQAEEFMNIYATAPITSQDICQEIGVSQRTLEYIFKDFYGVSPKAYLKRLRLNRFRQDLKTARAEGAKINEIAQEWGFWHSGQLATDYYRLFGELPSQTLKSSAQVLPLT